jgi:hypothetical protein
MEVQLGVDVGQAMIGGFEILEYESAGRAQFMLCPGRERPAVDKGRVHAIITILSGEQLWGGRLGHDIGCSVHLLLAGELNHILAEKHTYYRREVEGEFLLHVGRAGHLLRGMSRGPWRAAMDAWCAVSRPNNNRSNRRRAQGSDGLIMLRGKELWWRPSGLRF